MLCEYVCVLNLILCKNPGYLLIFFLDVIILTVIYIHFSDGCSVMLSIKL